MQYRKFNEEVLYLVQPDQMRESLKQRAKSKQIKDLMIEVDKVN